MAFTYEDYMEYKNRSVWGGLKYGDGEPIHIKADPIWFTLERALSNFYDAPVCDKDSIFYQADKREEYAGLVIRAGDNFIKAVHAGEIVPSKEFPKTKIVGYIDSVHKIKREYPYLSAHNDGMGI